MLINEQQPSIAFIGAGNMARYLIGGLIAKNYLPQKIWASNRNSEQCQHLEEQFHIHTTRDNLVASQQAQVLILAVKPQNLKEVVLELAEVIQQKKPLVISLAVGVTEATLSKWLGGEVSLIRCMPNLPAVVRQGATGLYSNRFVTSAQRDIAESIMHAIGITLWVKEESQIEMIAALSGSGPAYLFFVMEALEKAGIALGLSPEDAHQLTLQTVLGTAHLAMGASDSLAELRRRVTSKGGTTEKGLAALTACRVQEAFSQALQAAYDRSLEIAKAF